MLFIPQQAIKVAVAALAFVSTTLADSRPNIIFILCDDLGYGDLGVFHQNQRAALQDRSIPFFKTPHIDQIAATGATLTQHYCAAPVCAPSRASLLTGLTQGHAAVRDNQFDKALPDRHTLGSVLKQAGYATAAFGKWGLQGAPAVPESKGQIFAPNTKFPGWPSMPTDRGFDYFLGYVRHVDGHFHYPVEDKKQVWENKTEISTGLDLCFTTDLFTAASKKWIIHQRQQKPDQPFFAFLAYDTPHAKLQNPPCAYPTGGGLNGGVQWTGKAGAMLNTAHGTYDGWIHPDYANATWDHDENSSTAEVPWPDVQKRYANNVRRIDDAVGDLMQLLKDLKINDNTLVVFSSDNGPSEESYISDHPYRPTFFQGYGPFEGIKRDTLEGGMREPTIVRWPDQIKASTTHSSPNGHWDWLPTFAEAAGLTAPASSDGVSLLPMLTGKGTQSPSTIYSEYFVNNQTPNYPEFNRSHRRKPRQQMQVVFIDGYKGLRTHIQSANDDFEIYDLTKDPKELNNLAKQEGFSDIQSRMKARALQCRLPNSSAKRPYDDSPIPANPERPKGMPGVAAFTQLGSWPWMPNILNAPTRSAQSELSIKPSAFDGKPGTIQLETHLKVPADGDYTFSITSNSHTLLLVHDIRLIDEIPQTSEEPRTGSLPLKAGWHPIRLLLRTEVATPTLVVQITGPDGKDVLQSANPLQSNSLGW